MISKKLLGSATLLAAAALSPAAYGESLATCTLTLRHRMVDGLPATTVVNLAGDAVTTVATCSGQVRKTIVHGATPAQDIVTTATYDAAGLPLSRRDATGAGTDYAYDALGRKLTETDAAIAGKVRRYGYDNLGRLVSAVDPLGVETTYAYDLRDRKISDSTPMGGGVSRVIRYGYDALGRMTTLTDANGAVTTWGFDAAGRQVSKTYANGDTRAMAYDAAGRLVRLTDENGHDTLSVYDLAGRLLTKTFTADNSRDVFVYDAASRVTEVTKGRYAHTLRYGYDLAGRPITETHPDGTVVNLRYDAAGRTRRVFLADAAAPWTPQGGGDAAYAYDARGLLATVTAGDYATRYEYRANGQLVSTVDSRISDPAADILRTDRTYDAGARLLEVANTAANGEQVGVRYTLTADDQRTEALEESGQKWAYGYDGLKQLVSAKKTDTATSVVPPLDQSYAYDPMGNRKNYTEQGKSIAYTANSANQYTGLSESSSAGAPVQNALVYDKNGNLLNDGSRLYAWDAENQLIAVTPVNPTEGAQRVEYTYDWRMRRKDKKSFTYANGSWAPASTAAFKYHEWNPIRETTHLLTSSTSPLITTKSYVWGNDLSGNLHGAGGVGGLLSMKAGADRYFYAYDGNGNVRALVKADAANPAASGVVEKYAYDGFGRELATSTSLHTSALNTFRFSTKQMDAETGMNYYGYRYYAADKGRWINRDVIKERGGLNMYAQCGNGMIGAFDMLGMWKIERDSSKDIADVTAEDGDTWEKLAEAVSLNSSEASKWVTNYEQKPKCGKKYGVPNVIYKAWAGDVGWLGRRYVGWDLRQAFSSYKIKEYYYSGLDVGSPDIQSAQAAYNSLNNPFGKILEGESARKSLHGFYIDGHGNENGVSGSYLYFMKSDSTIGVAQLHSLNYAKTSLQYGLGLVQVRACASGNASKFCSQNGTCVTTPVDEYYWPLFGPLGGVDLPFGAKDLLPWNWF